MSNELRIKILTYNKKSAIIQKVMHPKSGFTLIELSIVLVIIGLLAAGIFVGKDLIRIAQLRGDIRVKQELDVAVTAFKLKYNCLPGDCAMASEYLNGAIDSDGNNVISGDTVDGVIYSLILPIVGPPSNREYINAYDHLARAKMIALAPFDLYENDLRPGVVTPILKSDEGAGLVIGCWHEPITGTIRQCHYFLMGVTFRTQADLSTDPPIYSGSDAFYIDSKLDNGIPDTGLVLSANSSNYIINGPQFVLTSQGSARCMTYDFSVPDKECTLLVRAGF